MWLNSLRAMCRSFEDTRAPGQASVLVPDALRAWMWTPMLFTRYCEKRGLNPKQRKALTREVCVDFLVSQELGLLDDLDE